MSVRQGGLIFCMPCSGADARHLRRGRRSREARTGWLQFVRFDPRIGQLSPDESYLRIAGHQQAARSGIVIVCLVLQL
jgi:hypothetical protein